MEIEKIKWELVATECLGLVGTKILIVYCGGLLPYHVHRENACHGCFERLDSTKKRACELVGELIEMGMEP